MRRNTKGIAKEDICWMCGRGNKDLEELLPNFDKKEEGLSLIGDYLNRHIILCGTCEGLIEAIPTRNECVDVKLREKLKEVIDTISDV